MRLGLMALHQIKQNLQAPEGVRRDVMDGAEHLVVPVVMIVDGVLNNALVTSQEYGKYVEAWNGRPVPVLHPERQGIPVSANQPDIISKNTIGHIFNARTDNGKLKAEAWINTDKARRLGYNELLSKLESGQIVEVSTGYFADSDSVAGEFNGKPYTEIHRNIRPDHLALLPDQEGACSIQDGCGTRVNSKRGIAMKVHEAFNTLAKAVGLRANCNCKESDMDLIEQASKLVKNEKLTAKQLTMLQELDEEQMAMVRALMDAMPGKAPETEEEGEDYEAMKDDEQVPAVNKGKDQAPPAKADADKQPNVDELVAHKVAEHLRRHEVTQKLVANDRCPFTAEELKTMNVDHLEKLEKSIRPTDYSGQGGFSAHAVTPATSPLRINRGVLSPKENKQ